MKLTHPLFSSPVCFVENRIPVLVVENPVFFRRLATELILQSEGADGAFILSVEDCPVECSSCLNVFCDYVHLSQVDKKVQTKVLNALLRIAQDDLAEDIFRLSRSMQNLLGSLATLSDHPVSYDQTDNLPELLKAMDFHIDLSDLPVTEALYEQMSLIGSTSKNQCFVLINAKAYLSADELQQLYRMVSYKKLPLMLLESAQYPSIVGEDIRLYDCDLCELRLDQ